MTKNKSSFDRRKYKQTFYEVYVTRTDLQESDGLITENEWLGLVTESADLCIAKTPKWQNGKPAPSPAWQFKSFPEGTPIYFESGRVFIREDDSETQIKLAGVAKKLKANIFGEDGTVFLNIDQPEPLEETATSNTRNTVKIPIEEERVRKKQSTLGVVLFMVLPVIVLWQLMRGVNPGVWMVLAVCSLGMAGYALYCFRQTKYYIAWAGGPNVQLFSLNTRSTDDTIEQQNILRSNLDPIELIWFPLQYSGKSKVEFHVRSRDLPWLVFFAGYNLNKAQAVLTKISKQLSVRTTDMSGADAATNIPKKYQLTPEEMSNKKRKK